MKLIGAVVEFCAVFLILVFFPFPSSVIGYSKSLYISEFILLIFILYLFLKNNYKVYLCNTMYMLLTLVGINLLTVFIAFFNGTVQFNMLSEVLRVIEWIVIYQFFSNWINRNGFEILLISIEKTLKVMYFLLIPFFIIEFFDLSFKELFRVVYCMSKSGSYFSSYSRISGPFRNPNFCAACIAIFMLGILMSKCNNLYKIFIALISSLIIYYTGSRTGLVSAIVVLIVAYTCKIVYTKNKNLCIKIFIFVFISGIFLMNFPFEKLTRYNSRMADFGKVLGSFGGRLELWVEALGVFKENILLGVNKRNNIVYDNLYIQLLVQHGLIGFIFYGSFYAINFWKTFKIVREKKSDISYFSFSVQTVIFVLGITMQVFDVLQIAIWYFFTVACIDCYKCLDYKKYNCNFSKL
ncbi:MAG: O-antigen ligase family protein [Lachnospiraceae bacterium]|nr:O-antigen ligase family protein [Lachnospiraceae bacterium]